ncbi:unnamed protein product, partial [marine sediment metagenome]
IGVELRLSHAGLIRTLLQKLGLSPDEQNRIFDQILDGDEEALARVESGRPELGRALFPLLDLKGKSSRFVKSSKALITRNLPELKPYIDDFISITDLLQALGCAYQIDIASGRGFEYYTGVIFQLFMGEEKIGGGGRYDALIPLMGGGDTPASGFALYLDRLMSLIKLETLAKPLAERILVKFEPEAMKEGFGTAGYLREAGCVAELYLGGQELANFRWRLDVQSKAPPHDSHLIPTLIPEAKRLSQLKGNLLVTLSLSGCLSTSPPNFYNPINPIPLLSKNVQNSSHKAGVFSKVWLPLIL